MSVTDINPDSRLGLERESAIVAIPVFGAYELFVQCLGSVLEHTPPQVPILVADDASPDPAIARFVRDLEKAGAVEHTVYYLRQPENVGFVQNMNTAFDVTEAADVISLNSDCAVAAGWFESLRDAAYSDSLVATASTLTNHGTILSIPRRNNPEPLLPQEWTFDRAAEAVRTRSPRDHPQIPTGIGHCLYIRRAALDLVGGFDEAFSPGYGEEVDFSQRCVLAGLRHVVADDVLVLHHGGSSFAAGGERDALQGRHDAIISSRYGYYDKWVAAVAQDTAIPLARSLTAASVALRGLTVTIDGRILTRFVTGTQLQTLELIAALSKRGIAVRVVVPPDLGDYAKKVLEDLPVQILAADEITDSTERTNIVHRPYQVSSDTDLPLLNQLGERLVITHLDLISYFNPGYHASFERWWDFQGLTRLALGMADGVIFISRHAARSALAGGIVDPSRASVIYLGTDHTLPALIGEARRPEALGDMDSRPFLLNLGTDFRHKNRRFALRLLEELRTRHGWDGLLVLAGPHVPIGSSAGEEAEFLAAHPSLRGHVATLGAIDEAEKAWLYREATGVLYPTIHEGFGLLPFEAAGSRAALPLCAPVVAGRASSLPAGVDRSLESRGIRRSDDRPPDRPGRALRPRASRPGRGGNADLGAHRTRGRGGIRAGSSGSLPGCEDDEAGVFPPGGCHGEPDGRCRAVRPHRSTARWPSGRAAARATARPPRDREQAFSSHLDLRSGTARLQAGLLLEAQSQAAQPARPRSMTTL